MVSKEVFGLRGLQSPSSKGKGHGRTRAGRNQAAPLQGKHLGTSSHPPPLRARGSRPPRMRCKQAPGPAHLVEEHQRDVAVQRRLEREVDIKVQPAAARHRPSLEAPGGVQVVEQRAVVHVRHHLRRPLQVHLRGVPAPGRARAPSVSLPPPCWPSLTFSQRHSLGGDTACLCTYDVNFKRRACSTT
jgi:hypothetical protein